MSTQAEAKLATAPFDYRLSLTFISPEQRAAQTALHAVYLELREVPREVRDPGVADVKLRWWEEEIALLYAGKARHPLTQALMSYMAALKGRQQTFLDLVTGARMDIAGAGLPAFEDVKRYSYRHAGALSELSALLAGAGSDAALLSARLLGNAACLADIASRGVAQALRGRLLFAAEDLRLHGIDKHIHGETQDDPAVLALVKDYGDRARAMHADAIRSTPVGERQALIPWRIRGALALQRARKQERLGSSRAAEPVELHPLSALFTAWNTARKSR
jgi:phytoene synthase